MKRTTLSILIMVSLLVGLISNADAFSSYLSALNTAYGGGSCSTCHAPPGQTTTLTAYGDQFRTALTTAGTPAAALTQIGPPGGVTTPAPQTCTSFTYGAWGACDPVSSTQTRNVISSVPAGCTGGTPVTSQACTATPPPPPVCTSFTYSAWNACDASGTQTRTATGSPAGCTGAPDQPLSQACTPPVPTPASCTSFMYSAWNACDASGTQTRTATGSPAGCTGAPDQPLSQACTPPVQNPTPTGDKMPVPGGKQTFYFAPVETPVLNGDPAKAKPIGVGPVANGGETLEIKLALGEFAAPVDVSFGIYALAIDPVDVFFLDNGRNLQPLSKKLLEAALELKIARPADARGEEEDDDDEEDDDNVKKEAQKRMVWKASVASLNENIFGAIPASALPEGLYMLMVKVSPAGKQNAHYLWMTSFVVQ